MAYRRTILHIDDDEDDRMLVREAIQYQDATIEVKEMENGAEGLHFLHQAQESELPCLIILDLNMPKKDGRKVIQEIKNDQRLSSIPVVLFTTSSSDVDKLFAKGQNVEIVTKPINVDLLSKVVQDFILRC